MPVVLNMSNCPGHVVPVGAIYIGQAHKVVVSGRAYTQSRTNERRKPYAVSPTQFPGNVCARRSVPKGGDRADRRVERQRGGLGGTFEFGLHWKPRWSSSRNYCSFLTMFGAVALRCLGYSAAW